MDLSRIKDKKLITKICEIAKNDGGDNPDEIENNGIQELGMLLAGGFGRELNDTEKEVILGLCIDFQSKTKSKNQKQNAGSSNTGSNNTAYGGNNVTSTGGGTAIGSIGNGCNFIIGNDSQIIINNPPTAPPKHKIDSASQTRGAALAKQLYNETVDSNYAYNDDIVSVMRSVNKKNAYSFFKEYARLNNNNPKIIQDVYSISDIFNRITLNDAKHVIEALLLQAESIGLKESDGYKNLNNYLINIKNRINKDPTKTERIEIDYAIEVLLEEMTEIYGDKK